jgi:2-phosphosulfolactate phosphatase
MPSRSVEVVFTPSQLAFCEPEGKIVVVIDIFRATTAICAAIAADAEKIIPVKTIEEALAYKSRGFILASERDGKKIEGFDMGNSPQNFYVPAVKGKTIVLSTTNGTDAILAALAGDMVLIGSFLNITALANKLVELKKDVILLCAGWKNKFNIEDTIFAGAIIQKLKNSLDCISSDATLAAEYLYNQSQNNLSGFLHKSSHYNRLKHLQLDDDLNFSLQFDITDKIPVFDGREIRAMA